MPVTPKFTVEQDDAFVIIKARVPYVRVTDSEIDIDGNSVSIYCKPYLLKLNFPGLLVDDERARASYDPLEVRLGR
jgi:protein SHQ1